MAIPEKVGCETERCLWCIDARRSRPGAMAKSVLGLVACGLVSQPVKGEV